MSPGTYLISDDDHVLPSWREEVTDVVRAVSGGMLFGVPLLYTMEVWWIGSHTTPLQTGTVLMVLAGPVFLLNLTGGFRSTPRLRLRDVAADTIESVAIGIVIAAVVLLLIREIQLNSPLESTLGRVLYEAAPFCLGIGVTRHFLDDSSGESSASDTQLQKTSPDEAVLGNDLQGEHKQLSAAFADLGATGVGALFIALSIAPTDEVPMIASRMSPRWLLLLMAASLLTSFGIVFVAGFSRQSHRHSQEGLFQRPITETVVCYLVALSVSGFLLWFFQRDVYPMTDLLARAIVLGFPAAVGGAAGRLAI